ncbi:MAG: gliding motility-associated C-terminal domain-containing protein [Cyclobacteriaceae bacterium]|nr:gliding motility-associated C-terminal domain-containing protein [Cyclobacteriaceae bacterium]
MRVPLPDYFVRLFFLVVFFVGAVAVESVAQSCGGFLPGPVGGGLFQASNGDICANTAVSPALLEIRPNNVDDGGNPNSIGFEIDWNDGSPLQQIFVSAGQAALNNPATKEYLAIVPHFFPPNGGNVQCEYFPTVRLLINGFPCPATIGIPPRFVRWNVDNENTGELRLEETITGVNEYLVCRGTQTTVTFTDRSILNCVPPQLAFPDDNRGERWRRFTYGTINTVVSGTGVQVNGIFEAYPFAGILVNDPTPAVAPLAPTQTLPITIPADAQVGAVFEIRMDYWNTCNPFPGVPVSQTARIRVVDQPPAPTPNNNVVCNGTNPLPAFSINLPGGFGGSIVTWFQDVANAPGPIIPGFTTASIPALSAIPTLNSTVPGVYRVWASFFGVNNIDGVSCESPRIPVTLTIRENLPTPAPGGATATICQTSTMTLTLPAAAVEAIGGATQYDWSVTGGLGVSFITTPTSATFDFSGVAIPGNFVTRTLNVSRRYTTAPNCPSPTFSWPVTIYRPTVGGSLSAVPDVCENTPLSPITLSGQTGNVQRWEVSFNGGAFIPDATLGTGLSISPGTLAPGNYRFRAIVQNGPCSEVASTIETVDVFPAIPATVGANQAFCQVLLTSNPLGGNIPAPGTGQWSVVSGPGAVVFNPSNATPNATATVSTQGVYVFRWTITSGLCVSTADIQVDFGTDPGPQFAGSDAQACGLTYALGATPPVIGAGQWTLVGPAPGTANFTTPNSPTSSVTVSAFGAYTFRWTVTSGNCVPVPDDVVITFNNPATSTADAVPVTCVNGTTLDPIAISGTIGGGATLGHWIIVSGSGTFDNSAAIGASKPGAIINDSYRPSAADFTAGSVQLQLVAEDPDGVAGPCGPVNSATLTITFDRLPSNVNAGPDQPLVCVTTASLAALLPVNGTGLWSDPLPAGVSFSNASLQAPIVSNLPVGPTTLRWTVTSAGGVCAPVFDDVIITRNPLPAVNPIAPEVCEVTAGSGNALNVILTDQDNAITGGAPNTTVAWFSDPIPGGPILPATIPQNMSTAVPTSRDYYVRVTNSVTTCQNTGAVVYTINPLPAAFDFAKSFCEDLPVGSNKVDVIDLNAADILLGVTGGAADRTVTWWEDAAATATQILITNPYPITASKAVFARVRNTLTGCEDVAQVNLNIVARPLAQPILGKSVVCNNGLELYQVSPVAGATYSWNIPSPPFSIFLGGGVNDALALVQFNTIATDDITLTISVNGCAGDPITKNVTVSPVPTPFIINGATAVCENDAGVPYSITPNNFPGSSYNWEIIPVGGALVANGQTSGSVLVNFLSNNVSIRVTESNSSNCFGPPVTVPIVVNRRPELADIVSEVCSNDPSGIILSESVASPVPAATYNITSVAVSPGLIPATRPTGIVAANGIAADVFENTTGGPLLVRYTIEPISADGCPGPAKIVELTVKPQPVLDPFLDVSRCSGRTTDVIFKVQVGSVAADQFIIDAITTNGLTALAGNPQTGQFNANEIADDVWQNLGTVPVDVIYLVRPINTLLNCVGNPAVPVRVTIYPEPQVAPDTKTICSGSSVNLALASNIPGTTYTWTVKSVIGGVTGANGGFGLTLSDILTNTSGAQGTVVYAVRARNPVGMLSCEGPAQDITILVDAAPSVIDYTETVCSDVTGSNSVIRDLVSLQPSINGDPGTTFTWFTTPALTPGTEITDPTAHVMVNNISAYARVANATCFSTGRATVTVHPKPEVIASSPLFNGFEIRCNGGVALINASASQGTSPYLFSINGGANYFPVGTFNNLTPGSYTILVQDAFGCSDESNSVVIDEPTPLSFTTIISDALCRGSSTGSIEVTAAGGIVGSYVYSLNGGAFQASNIFGNLGAGIYSVTIRDANTCTHAENVTVGEPTAVTGSITAQTNVDCIGNSTGSITILGGGGTGPYEYAIDGLTFQVSGTFTNLAAASYTVTVRDSRGCLAGVPVVITEPPLLTLNLSAKSDADCFGAATGSLTVAGSGGTAPYEYSLDGGAFQASGTFTALPGGVSYNLVVRDFNNCTAPLSITINQPPALFGSITSQTNVLCFGTNTGSVTVNGSGGSGLYQFSINGGAFGGSGTFTGLVAGLYTVTVRDQNNCSVDVPVSITEPLALSGSVVSFTDVQCNGGSNGSVLIAGADGTAPYQFSINGGAVFGPSGIFTGLVADNYTVIVRDANGCTFNVPFTISQPTALSANLVVSPALCRGTATGEVTALASGGTSPYSYSIDGSNFQLSGTFTGLPTGNYLVRVRDFNNCTFNAPFTITEPPQLTVAVQNKTDVDCNGNSTGSVTLLANGGVGGYTYSSDNITFTAVPTFAGLPFGNYTYFARDANNCIAQVNFTINEPSVLTLTLLTQVDVFCNGLNTGSIVVQGGGGAGSYEFSIDGLNFTPLNVFNGLAAGPYTITIRDANGCIGTLPVTITEPPAIVINSVAGTNTSCFLGSDGTITVNASGGTPDLVYRVLQDPSNTTGQSTGLFTNVRAGTYTINIRDANNCSIVSAPIIVGQPPQLTVSASVTSNFNGYGVSCENASDGVVQGAVNGGTGPVFTYTISPDPANVGSNTTGTFTNLPTGFYTISVSDNNGCPATAIPILVTEPFTLSGGFIGFDQFVCVGDDPGLINEIVPPFGGIGLYQYQWLQSTDGVIYSPILGATSVTFDPTATITQTTYFKRQVTSGSCLPPSESNVARVTINPLPSAAIATSLSPVCEGGTFFLNLTFTGQAPFRYDYTAVNASGTTNFTNLIGAATTPIPVFDYKETTTYTITRVRDFNGCESIVNEAITVPVTVIDPSFTILAPTAQCTGSTFSFRWRVDADVQYTWLWPDGQVEVISANNPLYPVGFNTITHVLVNGLTSSSIFLPVTLQAQNTVAINGCPTQSTQTVEVYPSVNSLIPPVDNVICSGDMISFGNSTQGATIHQWFYREKGTLPETNVVSTYTVDYTFLNNTAQNPIVYEVIYQGFNANGCTDSDTIDITVFKKSIAGFAEGPIPPYQGGSSIINFTNTSSIIDPTIFSYAWTFGADATPLVQADNAGPIPPIVYSSPGLKRVTLTVTNRADASCATIFEKQLLIPIPPFSADFMVTPLASCLPTTLVIRNLSGAADSFEWILRDGTNNQVATSNLNEPSFEINNPGVYTVYLTARLLSTNQIARDTVRNIEVFGNPQAIFTPRFTEFFVPDTPNDFFNDTQGANFFSWDFGDGGTSTVREPRYLYQQEGKYTVVLVAGYNHGRRDIDGDGILDEEVVCTDTASVVITAREGGFTKIPNAFTPNTSGPSGGNGQSGINDVFLPITSGVQEFLMQIFDRWGNLIFESKDQNQGWDGYDKNGRLMPAGVYVYKLVLRLSDQQRETKIGDVTLIR